MTSKQLWEKFEVALDATPIERWEFIAPRSAIATKRADIYKLFLRPAGTRRQWWCFEDAVQLVAANYPTTYYPDADAFKVFRGSANLLEFVGVDDHGQSKAALKRALTEVQRRLETRNL